MGLLARGGRGVFDGPRPGAGPRGAPYKRFCRRQKPWPGAIHLPRAEGKEGSPQSSALRGMTTPQILLISPPCGDTGISGAFSQRRTGRLRWAPPWGGAARSAVQAFLPEAKALARGNSLAPGRGKRGVPAKLCFAGHDDPTNPAYITTVWGYGYKWGF